MTERKRTAIVAVVAVLSIVLASLGSFAAVITKSGDQVMATIWAQNNQGSRTMDRIRDASGEEKEAPSPSASQSKTRSASAAKAPAVPVPEAKVPPAPDSSSPSRQRPSSSAQLPRPTVPAQSGTTSSNSGSTEWTQQPAPAPGTSELKAARFDIECQASTGSAGTSKAIIRARNLDPNKYYQITYQIGNIVESYKFSGRWTESLVPSNAYPTVCAVLSVVEI